ncbi:MAG TPA: gamma-glutamyltransferase, partial [Acetobacteraceae bacterium]|nr:gamma-glutamyltransferase [Acetobacteraceae bacterium]
MVASRRGIVAAAHPLAASAGAQLLAAGGNAFDAAVATCAALNVAEPFMSGLAGMGMAVAHVAPERRLRALDFVTRVPSQFPAGCVASREELRFGPLSVGTPGSLAGWCELHRRYGTRPFAEVLAPAIALAEEGVPLLRFGAIMVERGRDAHAPARYGEEWVATYGKGAPVLRQPNLARTLRAVAAEGAAYLHDGPLGRALVAHLGTLGGCLTETDLAGARPQWLEPLAAAFRDRVVHSLPPPSEAFQLLLTLRILDRTPPVPGGLDGAETLDRTWRAIRLAAGMRIRHNNPSPNVLADLLSDATADRLRARIDDPAVVEGPTEQFVAPAPENPDRGHTT